MVDVTRRLPVLRTPVARDTEGAVCAAHLDPCGAVPAGPARPCHSGGRAAAGGPS